MYNLHKTMGFKNGGNCELRPYLHVIQIMKSDNIFVHLASFRWAILEGNNVWLLCHHIMLQDLD